METQAKLQSIRIAPRKVRLVADAIRGLGVTEALDRLKFTYKGSALPMIKLVNSAVANAVENYGLEKSNLFIKAITVDGGVTLKRWMPKAFGRATPILKRSSHIIVTLGERVPTTDIKKKEKVSGDDIVKLGNFDELKALEAKNAENTEDKKDEKTKKINKESSPKKGFAKNIFNRKSG